MRYQLMASFRGLAFEAAVGPTDEDVVLFAAAPPPEGLQFEHDGGRWRAQVRRSELDALWESRPVGRYRGHGCVVLDDLGDRLHIAFTGHDAFQAEQLGYWQVDRGVYEVVVPRQDVTDLADLREDHPPRRPEPAAPAGPPAATTTGPGTPPPGMMTAIPGTAAAGSPGSSTASPGPLAAAPATADIGPIPAANQAPGSPEPVAQETSFRSAPGPVAGGTSFPSASGPLAGPAGPAPQDWMASVSTQPQRPMTAEPDGPNGAAAQYPAPQQPGPQDAGPQQEGSPQRGTQAPGARYAGTPSRGQHAAPEDTGPQDSAPQQAAQQAARWTAQPDAPAPGTPEREPHTPAPTGQGPVSPGSQRTWDATAVSDTASADAGTRAPDGRSGPEPSPSLPQRPSGPQASQPSPQRSPAPRSAPGSDDRPAAAAPPASRRSVFSLPADMMAPAPPREPPGNGTGHWHPWGPGSGRPGASDSGPASTEPAPASTEPAPASTEPAPASTASSPEAAKQARQNSAHSVFRELVGLAAIPDRAYAVDEDVDGAHCLVRTDDGFEVYSSAGNEKREVRYFLDEESAYFYLFGVLAADSLRSGRLTRRDG